MMKVDMNQLLWLNYWVILQMSTRLNEVIVEDTGTVEPTKSDSDISFCLQLLCKTFTCTLHLCLGESM